MLKPVLQRYFEEMREAVERHGGRVEKQEEGFPRFSIHWHTMLWHELDAKKPGKAWGVDVAGAWYWYSSWVDVARKHCADNAEEYR